MKKQQAIAFAFLLGMAMLAYGMLVYNPDKDGAFWVVLVTTELALGLSGAAVTLFIDHPSEKYPVEVSLLVASLVYLALCTLCNLFFAGVVHLRAAYLVVAHVLLLGFYVVASLLLRLILHSYVSQEHELDETGRCARTLMVQIERLKLLCGPLPSMLQERTTQVLCRLEGQIRWWPLGYHSNLRRLDWEIEKQFALLTCQLEQDGARDDAALEQAVAALDTLLTQRRAGIKALRFPHKKQAG